MGKDRSFERLPVRGVRQTFIGSDGWSSSLWKVDVFVFWV